MVDRYGWDSLGWYKTWHIVDWILGDVEVERRLIRESKIRIMMAEGVYDGEVRIVEVTRRRVGRVIGKVMGWVTGLGRGGKEEIATVDIEGGIPFAGKGENSWDCGDDGLYGISFALEGDGRFEIERKVIKAVEERRKKYGIGSEEAYRSRGKDYRKAVASMEEVATND